MITRITGSEGKGIAETIAVGSFIEADEPQIAAEIADVVGFWANSVRLSRGAL